MRAQRVWVPVEHDYSAARVDQALKRALSVYLPDFRKQAIEQKVRFQGFTDLVRSELRHLRSSVWEWFCLSFQI